MNQIFELLHSCYCLLLWIQCFVFVGPETERSNHRKQSHHCSKGDIIQCCLVSSGLQRIVFWKEHGLYNQVDLTEFETQFVPFINLSKILEFHLPNCPDL